MEFSHRFHVPVDCETTFETLTSLERVAPCLAGATLEEVDGDTYTGRVKVRVGPIAVTYRGEARLTEKDVETMAARIAASGKETRGAGAANEDGRAMLEAAGDGTDVTVVTDLNVTGKPAQFGRGIMADVGSRIIEAFAEGLEAELTVGDELQPAADAMIVSEGPGPEATAPGAQDLVRGARRGSATSFGRRLARDSSGQDAAAALDLVGLVGLVWWELHRR